MLKSSATSGFHYRSKSFKSTPQNRTVYGCRHKRYTDFTLGNFKRKNFSWKVVPRNTWRRTTFNAKNCCRDVLQVFESCSNTRNIVAYSVLKFSRVTLLRLAFNPTMPHKPVRCARGNESVWKKWRLALEGVEGDDCEVEIRTHLDDGERLKQLV